ncbi:hypothetical protein M2447_002800 [Ereboglobus sp. PH5-10]
MRKKFHFIYQVSNSRNENIFDNKLFRGVRWPMQFFIVRIYTAANKRQPLEVHQVWPSSKIFSLYDSFAASSKLPGKELPDENASSEDFRPSVWKRLGAAWRAVKKLVFFGTLLTVGGYVVFFHVMLPALGAGGQAVQKTGHGKNSAPAPAVETVSVSEIETKQEVVTRPPAETDASSDSVAVATPETPEAGEVPPTASKEPVRVVFRSPRFVRYSDGVRLIVGEFYADKEIISIDAVGVHFDDGATLRHGEHAEPTIGFR